MSFRNTLNSTRQTLFRVSPKATTSARAYSPPANAGPVRQFFAHGVPVECYPIIGVTACVLSFATFSISKHVMQDRDHLRWLPGGGGVKYIPTQWPTRS